MKKGTAQYEKHKQIMRDRQRAATAAGQDIGAIPAVVDHAARKLATESLFEFCQICFPKRFYLGFSKDHLDVIHTMERIIVDGGLFALAMPRGSGKTTISEVAVVWAGVTGRHRFTMLVGSSEKHATDMLKAIKGELQRNAKLVELFPEVVFPIAKLEGESRRAAGQTHHGEKTGIGWNADELIFPTIPGSKASGSVIKVAGLTGNIRGAKHATPDGDNIRPSLVILDDPQTRESAASPSQCQTRYETIVGDVLGLAGPGERFSMVMPCTVVRKDDLSDRMLDMDKTPMVQSRRTKMVYKFPTNSKLWDEYHAIRVDEIRDGGDGELSNAFYIKHRKKMDAGSAVAWEDRKRPNEVSAIQHAMNLRYVDEAAFYAEYQNDPLDPDDELRTILTADEIAAKLNNLAKLTVPPDVDTITVAIDVQKKFIIYTVIGWAADFSGYVLDYGTWPDQRRQYFTLRDAKITMRQKAPGTGLDGAIYKALETLTATLLGREYVRTDGTVLHVARCLIDANWGESTDVVYKFCRQSIHRSIINPAHGRYVGATSQPWHLIAKKKGERRGLHWRQPPSTGRGTRHVLVDANYWKTFLHNRLATPTGDSGALTLFGKKASRHQMIAEQLTAEWPTTVEAKGRSVDEWKIRVEHADNHFLDTCYLAACAASIAGVELKGVTKKKVKKGKRKMSDMQRKPA